MKDSTGMSVICSILAIGLPCEVLAGNGKFGKTYAFQYLGRVELRVSIGSTSFDIKIKSDPKI